MKRSLHITGRVDDDGNTIYSLSESQTISKHIRDVTQAEYAEVAREVAEFNEENSDLNMVKRMFARRKEERDSSPDPKAYAIAELVRAGILYPDGTALEYDENKELISFNEIKRRRANA